MVGYCFMLNCGLQHVKHQLYSIPLQRGPSIAVVYRSQPLQSFMTPRGGTCENFDRDARVIFLGLKFTKTSFFLGFAKLSSFFWG